MKEGIVDREVVAVIETRDVIGVAMLNEWRAVPTLLQPRFLL